MKMNRVQVNVKELAALIEKGQKLQSNAKNGKIFLEFSGRGPNPLWMKDLAKLRGVENYKVDRKLRNRLGNTRFKRSVQDDAQA